MTQYIAITFAPVQGFIEKSRKLRDLYGASGILSHLSSKVVEEAKNLPQIVVISPGIINVESGTPNRIFLKLSEDQDAEKLLKHLEITFLDEWRRILNECRKEVQRRFECIDSDINWCWHEEWNHWANHAWEFFGEIAEGSSVEVVRQKLENRKLSRNWIAINWIGESSSLSGSDAIAFPGLGAETRNPKNRNWGEEAKEIQEFYRVLAFLLDGINPNDGGEPEGKFIAANERLSIPELTKRLVTVEEVAKKLGMPYLDEGFQDIVRKPEDNPDVNIGQWTGWFMGDGDNVGKYLRRLSEQGETADEHIKQFSKEMGEWGQWFYKNFLEELGRIVYAGGDDFLGIIYNKNFSDKESEEYQKSISGREILEWLQTLNRDWKEGKSEGKEGKSEETKSNVTLSVGFVWAAPSVPLRDILQHCREAEQISKKKGRDRVTIRIVFNSGQYVQWTCPWKSLKVLESYCDRDGNTGDNANWNHIYNDWTQLKARHAVRLQEMQGIEINKQIAFAIFDLYFNNAAQTFEQQRQWNEITGDNTAGAIVNWIDDLIQVSWQLCPNLSFNSNL